MKRKASPILQSAALVVLQKYPIEVRQVRQTDRGVSNTSFFVTAKQGEYVLKIYAGGSSLEDIEFEVGFLDTLSRSGVMVPHVKKDKQGKLISEVLVASKVRYAMLMEKLPGRIVEAKDLALIPVIARMHARLHMVAAKKIKPRRSSAKTVMYTELWLTAETKKAKKYMRGLASFPVYVKQVQDILRELGQNKSALAKLPAAECHLDYDSDNILTNGKTVTGVIDFGDVTNSPLVVDIGNSLCWWLFCNLRSRGQGILTKYITAYGQVRRLSLEERKLLLLCVKIRNVGLAAYFYIHGLRSGDSYVRKVVVFNTYIDTLVL